eukprot:4395263-Prymnesium_polylepis.2
MGQEDILGEGLLTDPRGERGAIPLAWPPTLDAHVAKVRHGHGGRLLPTHQLDRYGHGAQAELKVGARGGQACQDSRRRLGIGQSILQHACER